MDVADVKIIFRNPWSVEPFTRLVFGLHVDPTNGKLSFCINFLTRVYEHIYGNCVKKDKDF